jgi:hypothetical protein
MKRVYLCLFVFLAYRLGLILSVQAAEPVKETSYQSGQVVDGVIYHKQPVDFGAGKASWLHFALKMPTGWKTGMPVRGVMCIGTWKQTPDGVIWNVNNMPAAQWATKNSFAVLSWSRLKFYEIGISNDEMDRETNQESDRDFDIAARQWERGIKRLIDQYKLPAENYLLDSISGGAQTAHRLALRKPQYFAAIHIHINSSYDIPTPAAKKMTWLVTTGEREYGYTASQRFYYNALELGYSIIYKAGEGLGHAASKDIDKLTIAFFDYMVPFLPDYREKEPQAKGDAHRLLRQPPFIGDWLNQQAMPVGKAHLIQGKYQTALPSRAVAAAWGPLIE